MKTKKRLLATLLTLAMVFSMLPMGALAEEAVQNPPVVTETPVVQVPVGPQDPGAGPRVGVCALSGATDLAKNTTYDTFAAAVTAINGATAADDAVGFTITLTADCSHASTMPSKKVTIKSAETNLANAPTLTVTNYLVTAGSNTGTSATHFENLNLLDRVNNSNTMHAYGAVSLKHCTVTGTSSGALLNVPGTLSLDDVTVKNNGTGGAIVNNAQELTIKNSSITEKITLGTGKLVLQDVPKTDYNVMTTKAAGAVIATAAGIDAAAAAAKIIVNGGADWKAVASGNDIVLERLPVRYVLAGATSGTGSVAKPFDTLQAAYSGLPDTGGEIRVLSDLTAAATTTFGTANKNVTINSYYRIGDDATVYVANVGKPQDPNGAHTIKRGAGLANETAFTVSAGSVTLKNIVFDGGAVWSSAEAAHLLDRTNGGITNVATESNDGQLFTVTTDGALTLDTGAVLQNNDRTSGTDSIADKGSAVYVNGGTLTMNNGARILNNRVAASGFTGAQGDGAAVSVWGATGKFYMTGGTISGNTTRRIGGAIRVAEGNMYLSGGTIFGNATTYVYSGSKFGGGISVNSGTLHLSGNPVVKDNLNNTDACNISYDGVHIVMANRLTGVANIGVTGVAGAITTATAASGDLAFVHSDDLAYGVVLDGTTLKLVALLDDVYVKSTGNDSTGTGATNAPFATIARAYVQAADNGTIHVMDDIQVGTNIAFNSNKVVTITSCKTTGDAWTEVGDTHTISQIGASQVMFGVEKGTVNLANIVLKGKAAHDGRLLNVLSGATACIQDGTVLKDSVSNFSGGAAYIFTDGTLKMTGGTITGNSCTGASCGGAVYAVDGAHFQVQGDVKITGNTANSKPSNVYLQTGKTITITSPLTAGSAIGVSSAATPTPGHPVLVATGANATDATHFTSDQLNGAGIRAAKSSDTDRTGIYLDAAEKMVAKIIHTGGETLYKTFDAAIKAITDDSSANALDDDASGHYKIELLADCTTNGAFPVETIAMESTSGQHYTLLVNNFITTTGGTFTAKDIKFADATPQHEWLQAKSPWTFTGCELPNFAVVGVTVTLDTGTVVNGNIRIDSNTAGNLAIKAGNVPVNGTISINNATSKITLLTGSTADMRYNVEYANNIDLSGGTKIVMDGTTTADSTLATNLAKMVTVSGGSDATKEWVAIGSTNDVKVKEAKAYWVSKDGSDSSPADGTYLKPYKTIAKAYTAGAAEVGLDIRVLSDLPDTLATTFATEAITSVKISSYKGENAVADKPWTITRKDAAGALLTVTKGAVNLTNITLDGKGDTLASDTALVTVAAGTALTLGDKATLQNNKNNAPHGLGGGVAVAGTLTMNPGSTITGNTLTGANYPYGGGVYVADNATFQMNGGTISTNSVTASNGSGGGIMVDPAATTATVRIGGDAQITDNFCGANGAAIHGGADGSTIAISGNAKITSNKITAAAGYVGAAVYPYNGSLVLSNGVQITANSNQDGKACNVYLGTGKTITIGGAHMGAGSAVGVYCETMPSTAGATVDIATNAVEADKAHFSSDKVSDAGIKFDGDKVVLAYDERYIPPTPVYPTPGPEPERPDPNVTVEPGPGKVTTFPQNPDPGTKVTVTIEPEPGWKIDKVIIVTVPGGDPVVVTGTNPVTYIAPDPNTVKITVKYIRIPTDPKITGVSKLLETDKHIAYMKGDDMGNFNPEKGITRAETAQMFYNLLRNKDIGEVAKFSDVEAEAWYANAVNALAELKIISGRSADKFAPKDYISRAEFTAIAMRFADSVKGEKTFTDVPAGYWAESYIAGAAQYGWINGYDDGTFNPLGNIKRCEATKIVNAMLWRFADTAYVDSAKDLKLFPDVNVKNWAFYDIVEATNPHDFKHDKPGVETWAK